MTTDELLEALKAPTVGVSVAAEAAGVSAWAMYQAIKAGESPFPIIRVGRAIRVPSASLRQILGLSSPSGEDG